MGKHAQELIRTVAALRGKQSASEIANKCGLTRNAVIGIWRDHCGRKCTEEELHFIRSKHVSKAAKRKHKEAPGSFGWALYWKRKREGAMNA